MKPVILDASALIAFIAQEKGAEKVSVHIANAIISSVNLAEVASYMVFKGLDAVKVTALLDDLALIVADYDNQQALLTGQLRAQTSKQGLSLGDRACLALALTRKLPVLSADTAWKALDIGVKIQLIR